MANPRLTNKLSGMVLSDWNGEPHELASYWKDRPIVLVFIRHFG